MSIISLNESISLGSLEIEANEEIDLGEATQDVPEQEGEQHEPTHEPAHEPTHAAPSVDAAPSRQPVVGTVVRPPPRPAYARQPGDTTA